MNNNLLFISRHQVQHNWFRKLQLCSFLFITLFVQKFLLQYCFQHLYSGFLKINIFKTLLLEEYKYLREEEYVTILCTICAMGTILFYLIHFFLQDTMNYMVSLLFYFICQILVILLYNLYTHSLSIIYTSQHVLWIGSILLECFQVIVFIDLFYQINYQLVSYANSDEMWSVSDDQYNKVHYFIITSSIVCIGYALFLSYKSNNEYKYTLVVVYSILILVSIALEHGALLPISMQFLFHTLQWNHYLLTTLAIVYYSMIQGKLQSIHDVWLLFFEEEEEEETTTTTTTDNSTSLHVLLILYACTMTTMTTTHTSFPSHFLYPILYLLHLLSPLLSQDNHSKQD